MTELDWEKNKSSHSVTLRGRTALAIIVGAICLLANAPNSTAVDDDDRYGSWFFTPEEVAAAYQYQQNYGERLRFPLRAGPCLFRGGEFATSYRRNPLAVSCRFVLEVTRHMKEMLDAGAAKFLFPLDADHAHLGVPMEVWNNKYKNLPLEQVFPAILREPGLVALYHTAEHLRVTDRKTGAVNAEAKAWQEKRNVLGYFDGRPIKILQPDPKGSGVAMPEDYYSYGGFSFLASPHGELYLASGLNMITFDIAFDANAFDDAEEQHAFSAENILLRAEQFGRRSATAPAAAPATPAN